MTPELIKKIESYKLDKNTRRDIIKSFLNTCISAKLYEEIEGVGTSGKTETIYNYLNNVVKEPEVKQPLNIVIADDSSSLEYVSYLNEKYEVTVHKSTDVKNPKDIDLVLFTGGEDVNPERYYENLGKYTHVNSSRDEKEIETYNKFSGYCFLLGICRGNQLLTVLSGGKLIQHVEGHGRDHSMILNNRFTYKITSSHHQMIYPFDLNEKDYELIAYSEYFQSKTYLNGNNEEIELPNNFLEPEIVYYKNTNALCIQGHPEWSHCEKKTSIMCLNLIDKYLKKFKQSKEVDSLTYSQSTNPFSSKYGDNYYSDDNENHYEEDHQDYYEEEQLPI